MRTRAAALALGLWVTAPVCAAGQEGYEPPSDEASAPAPQRARDTSTSTDVAGYPPLRRAPSPRPVAEVHGLAVLWWTPLSEEGAPHHGPEPFRARLGVVRLDAHPVPELHVLTRFAITLANPLYDVAVSWTRLPFLNVTAGQFRMPLGAAGTTLAGQLVMLDRPQYVYGMTKSTFRDVGLMLGTGEGGLADGLFHYRAALALGNGRLLEGDPPDVRDARDLLWVMRAILDVGPRLAPGTRLALGGQLAYTRDPAIDLRDNAVARERASHRLGRTWTPFERERETMLAGADLTFVVGGVWAQAEWLFLESRPTDGGPSRRATGGSLELAYTLPWRIDDVSVQLAARGELFDPDLDRPHDDQAIASAGLNVQLARGARASAFGSVAFRHEPASGAEQQSGELALRLALSF